MNNNNGIKISIFLGALILTLMFLTSYLSFEPKTHIHVARLDKIDYNNTWRIHLKDITGNDIIVGVCKICGRITDMEYNGTNFYSHFPYNSEKYSSAEWDPFYSYQKQLTNFSKGFTATNVWHNILYCYFVDQSFDLSQDFCLGSATNLILIGNGAKPSTNTDELVIKWNDNTELRQRLPHKRVNFWPAENKK